MKRSVLPILLLAFLLAEMSSVSFADSSNDDKVNPADIIQMLETEELQQKQEELQQKQEDLKQKQERLDQLWKDVKESVAKKYYQAAITKLEEILILDKDSEEAKTILAKLKNLTRQDWGEGSKAGERKVAYVNGVEFAFRWCPPGTFIMGEPKSETGPYNRSTQHEVTLSKGFWIMETEVTQKQWIAIMGTNPSYFKGDDMPVHTLSWGDCNMFCHRCDYLGFKVKLPTEAQWEYACRAGSTTTFFWGSALNGDKANCDGRSPYGTTTKGKYIGKTTPVRSYEANAWGLYDMHGNVGEWCADYYGEYSFGYVSEDPTGPQSGIACVIRGGQWRNGADFCRSGKRAWGVPTVSHADVGFRVVLIQ